MVKKGNGMKTSKTKRVLAIIGVVILIGLYLFSLIAAILAKPYANGLFLSSVFATFIIPIFIYVFLLMNRTFGKKKEGYSVHELNKMKKENKKNEMEEAKQSKKYKE